MSLGLGNSLIDVNKSSAYKAADSDALTFLNAVTTAGGNRTYGADKAIDTFIAALKTNSLWTNLVALYPFYGGNAGSHAINARTPGTKNITWNGVMNHDPVIGAAGDMFGGYGDTGIVPNTQFANNQVTLGLFAVNGYINAYGGGWNIGAFDATGGSFGMQLRSTFTSSTGALFVSTVNGTFFGTLNTNALNSGHFTASQSAAAVGKLFRNGVQVGSNNTGAANGSRPTNNIFIFADSKGTGVENNNLGRGWLGLAYVYTGGLADADVVVLNGLVQTLMTNMGRPVTTRSSGNNTILMGDSLTVGSGSSTALTTYPAVLKTLGPFAIADGGVAGIQISGAGSVGKDMLTDYADVPTSLFMSGVKNIYVVWAGTNDIANQADTAGIGTTTYNNLVTYVGNIRTANPTSKIAVCTCIDRQGGITGTQGHFNTARAVYNTAINADTTHFDTIVNLAALSQFTDATNTTYFNADKTHLTDTGYALVANQVYNKIILL